MSTIWPTSWVKRSEILLHYFKKKKKRYVWGNTIIFLVLVLVFIWKKRGGVYTRRAVVGENFSSLHFFSPLPFPFFISPFLLLLELVLSQVRVLANRLDIRPQTLFVCQATADKAFGLIRDGRFCREFNRSGFEHGVVA